MKNDMPPRSPASRGGGETLTWLKFAIQNTLRNRRRSLVTVSIAALGTACHPVGGRLCPVTPMKRWPRRQRAPPVT
jgi:hypothetical protein